MDSVNPSVNPSVNASVNDSVTPSVTDQSCSRCGVSPSTLHCAVCSIATYCSNTCLDNHSREGECTRLLASASRRDVSSLLSLVVGGDSTVFQRCGMFEAWGVHRRGPFRRECGCGSDGGSGSGGGGGGGGSSGGGDDSEDDSLPWAFPIPSHNLLETIHKNDTHLSKSLVCLRSLVSPVFSWRDWYATVALPLDNPLAIVTDVPMTIFYILSLYTDAVCQGWWCEESQPSVYVPLHTLSIHVVGVDKEVSQVDMWQCLAQLLPMMNIEVEMIGMHVREMLHQRSLLIPLHTPIFVQSSSSAAFSATIHHNLTFYFQRGVYHISVPRSSPRLIIAPNAGLGVYEEWTLSIHYMISTYLTDVAPMFPSLTVFFTDYNEASALFGYGTLRHVITSTMRVDESLLNWYPPCLNPFRQPIPFSPEHEVVVESYSNAFIFGVIVKHV